MPLGGKVISFITDMHLFFVSVPHMIGGLHNIRGMMFVADALQPWLIKLDSISKYHTSKPNKLTCILWFEEMNVIIPFISITLSLAPSTEKKLNHEVDFFFRFFCLHLSFRSFVLFCFFFFFFFLFFYFFWETFWCFAYN